MKRWIHAKSTIIDAASNIGTYRGVSYGMEDSGDQLYYFVKRNGEVEYAELEDELFTLIDEYIERGYK